MPISKDAEHTAVVTGCTSGLGLLITCFLLAAGWEVIGVADADSFELPDGVPTDDAQNFSYFSVDLQWPSDIMDFAADLERQGVDQVHALINCAGVNALCPFESLNTEEWERVMDINAKAPWVMTRCLLPMLANKADPWHAGTVINIVSNAANVPMTHSLFYNASKAAALMVTKQMARELFKSHGLTIFSVSPNKLEGTGMSRQIEEAVPALRGWTPEEAQQYQLNALPTGMETDPRLVAEFIGYLLSKKERHIYFHGCNIPYGG
jgi:NAD(P)-dependent dehydrogenase (short-subunit alcohol dehydrogenase family)